MPETESILTRRAERGDELEQFASIVAHELKAPLGHILRFAERLASEHAPALPPAAMRDVRGIAKCTDDSRRLIDDLLALSEVGRWRGSMANVDLSDVMSEVARDLRPALKAGRGTITWGALPTVRGHRRLLIRLFANLIDNSLKFRSDEPPVVHVWADDERETRSFEKTGFLGENFERGRFHRISVKDNGIGIAPEFAAEVFAPFRRLHPKTRFEGSGIGLTICKKIVARHGGRIWAGSGGRPRSEERAAKSGDRGEKSEESGTGSDDAESLLALSPIIPSSFTPGSVAPGPVSAGDSRERCGATIHLTLPVAEGEVGSRDGAKSTFDGKR